MIPLNQIQIEKDLLCQFSHQPVKYICVLPSCKQKSPFICGCCKESGCLSHHSHQGFKKHIPLQTLTKALTHIKHNNTISSHLKEIQQQYQKLISDLQVIIVQHSQTLSSKQFEWKLKPNAITILKLIEERQFDRLSGSDLNYLLKEQLYINMFSISQKLYFEKNRLHKIFDTLRQKIGDYYYQKEKKAIKQCLKSANKKREEKDLEEAILEYTKVLQLYPNNEEALCFRGLCYSLDRNYDKALQDYETCLKVDPRHAQTMSNIAHIFALKKEKKLALQWYNRSVSTDSGNDLTLFNRGLIQMSMGNLEQAKVDFEKALRINECQQYYEKKAKCHQILLERQEAEECFALGKRCIK